MPTIIAGGRPQSGSTSQINKLLEQMQKGFYQFNPNEAWAPCVNLYETERSYLACVDLSGVEKGKIDLNLDQNRLVLRGHREIRIPDLEKDSSVKVHLMEIDHGSFSRAVELPAGADADKISAQYIDGLLWIEIPKRAQP